MDVYLIQLSRSGHISTIWWTPPGAGLCVSRQIGQTLMTASISVKQDCQLCNWHWADSDSLCTAANQWPALSYNVLRSRVYTMDTSQKYANNDAMRYDAIQYHTIQHDMIWHDTMQYDKNTIRYDTIRYMIHDTIRYLSLIHIWRCRRRG